MTKRMFWPLFRDAWEDAFTSKNIKKAFEKTGIWSLNQQRTIKSLQKPSSAPVTPSRIVPLPIATPMDCHGVRRLLKMSPSEQKALILERAVLRLATEFEIQNHVNKGLRNAIINEKKRRQRGIRLNLLGQESGPDPQFFSPTKVLAAKEYQDSKEAREQEEQRQKALKKEENARRRAQAAAQKQEAALQREIRKEAAKEEREAEKARKAAEIEQRRLDRALQKQAKELAALERKMAAQKRKDDAAAAAAARALNKSFKNASTGRSGPRKKAPIRSKKVRFQFVNPTEAGPSIENENNVANGAANAVEMEKSRIQTRSGRTTTMPQRFKE